MYWDQLTSPELDALDRSQVVVLPISATEQHGAHLPLATDRLIGEYFCRRLAAELSPTILILPSLAVCCSEHHLGFAGTLSLSHPVFLQQMEEILQSVVHHGFRKLAILNSHGGNQAIGQVLVERFGHRHADLDITFATWWKMALEALTPLNESGPGGAGHAGEFETSLLLHFAPDQVRTELIKPGANVPTHDWAEGDMLKGGKASLYRSMKEMTPNGVYGRPEYASAAKGKEIADRVTTALSDWLQTFGKGRR